MPEAPSVCPIWDLNEVITVRLEELKTAFQAQDLLHVSLPGTRGMAFHQVHCIGPIGYPWDRGADGHLLGDTGGLHHAQMVVARSMPVTTAWTRAPLRRPTPAAR